MPDDGLSFGNSVPSRVCLAANARARFAATARRGMYSAPTNPLPELRSWRRRNLPA